MVCVILMRDLTDPAVGVLSGNHINIVRSHQTMTIISDKVIQDIFTLSLQYFLDKEAQEIVEGVNERNNCARWAIYLQRVAHEQGLTSYFADAEYNRKQNGEIKTILDGESRVVTINCDLILHSRGMNIAEDNLIAIEIKKFDRPEIEKQKDRDRLRALTQASYDGIWMNDGSTPPEHVCGYRFGAFVELDRRYRRCTVEYFKDGQYKTKTEHSF